MSEPSPDGVLLLDKPPGYSSTQALARCKRLLRSRKAGHTGTLDPFATGLLPLVFGEATKFSRFLIDSTKGYRATLRLGRESSTGDTEGVLTESRQFEVDERRIDDILRRFVGFSDQIPPMHSAVRIGGKRLYELAREGLEVAREPRRIHIQALQRERYEGDELVLSVTCSKGTYIRTLAQDVGRALGCGAYLVALRRTRIGPFVEEEAIGLEALQAMGEAGARELLLPVDVLVRDVPRCDASSLDAWRFTRGQEIDCPEARPGAEFAVFGTGGRFLGVGRSPAPARLAPLRLLATADAQIP